MAEANVDAARIVVADGWGSGPTGELDSGVRGLGLGRMVLGPVVLGVYLHACGWNFLQPIRLGILLAGFCHIGLRSTADISTTRLTPPTFGPGDLDGTTQPAALTPMASTREPGRSGELSTPGQQWEERVAASVAAAFTAVRRWRFHGGGGGHGGAR